MALHPILKELGLSRNTLNNGSTNFKKGDRCSSVSALDILNHLLEKKLLKEDSIRIAVRELSEAPTAGNSKTPDDGRSKTEAMSSPSTTSSSRTKTEFRTRHIALRFLYNGASYSGLAQNVGQESDNSVERALFQALLKARLVESRGSCGYSRCGRTDRGVSAAGQVVAMYLKSAIPADASLDADGIKLLDKDPAHSLPKNEHEKVSAWVVPRKHKKATENSSDKEGRVFKELSEYPYAKIINNLLPPEIRILGWAPVSDEFSARFSATTRTYRYFFVRRQLALQQMQAALQLMTGKHDFRNFCKMDVEKVYNFERIIHSAKIVIRETKEDGRTVATEVGYSSTPPSAHQMCYVEIHGQAFLWHQIRCIMEVLFLVGNRLEKPSVVAELFNVQKYPGKPAYPLAPEKPLVLNDCGYPNLQIGYSVQNVWNVSCQLEQQWEDHILAAARIRNCIAAFENVSILKEDLLEFATAKITERNRKLQKSGLLSSESIDEKVLPSTLPQCTGAALSWKDALLWLQNKCHLIPDIRGLNTAIHIPLLQRSRGTTYEQKIEALQKSEKRRQKYEENVIKKRKTAAEDVAFYNHMAQQGGTGM